MKGRLSLGPFDAAVREPYLIEVELEGSRIEGAELKAGMGRRGIEAGFAGLSSSEGADLASRICARSSIAHSLAFCQAVEDAAGLEVEEAPAAFRVVLAEYERLISHLGVISDIGRSLEDEIIFNGPRRYIAQIRKVLVSASGNSFGFGMIVPGGVVVKGDKSVFGGLSRTRRALKGDCSFWLRKIKLSKHRLLGGCFPGISIPEGSPCSPAFRASGYAVDIRSGDMANGYYENISYLPVTKEGGRTIDRLQVLLEEIKSSLSIIEEIDNNIEAKPVDLLTLDHPFRKSSGVGVCESPEGAIQHRVFFGSEGRILRNKINSAVENVAAVMPSALSGVYYEDIVAAVLSFYVCQACLDR